MSMAEACEIIKILNANNYKGHIVGGAVRDLFLDRIPEDIDITTDAIPSEVHRIFDEVGYFTIPVGEKFGTVAVTLVDQKLIEITTYRSEGRYTDQRHPNEVKWETDIVKDLERRDFTINAMALNPINGELVDPFKGLIDLRAGVIRAVGDPMERFGEDPLRMMRMIRFGGKLEFIIDEDTYNTCIQLHMELLNIPSERIRDELFKILDLESAPLCLEILIDTGIMGAIMPEVTALQGIPQPPQYHRYHVLEHCLMTVLSLVGEKPLLKLAGLLHDVGKFKPNPEPPYFPDHIKAGLTHVADIAGRLKLSIKDAVYLFVLVKHHMDSFNYRNMNDHAIRRWLSKFEDISLLEDLFKLQVADIIATGILKPQYFFEIEEFKRRVEVIRDTDPPLTTHSLAISGHDLMNEFGLKPSAQIGEIKKRLLEIVLEDPTLNTSEILKREVGEILKKTGSSVQHD